MKTNILLPIIPLIAGILLLYVGFKFQMQGPQYMGYFMIIYGFVQHLVNTRRLNEMRKKVLSLDKVL